VWRGKKLMQKERNQFQNKLRAKLMIQRFYRKRKARLFDKNWKIHLSDSLVDFTEMRQRWLLDSQIKIAYTWRR
jgi:hypothetical protein